MASVTTKLASICGGGNHLSFTVDYGARSRTVQMERGDIADDITDDELAVWCRLTAKLVKAGKTNAQAAAVLQAGFTVSG